MILPQLDYYDMGTGVMAFSTTRHGGCSKGSYATFNINRYCGDREEDIGSNRRALCRLLGIGDNQLVMPHQVHQTIVAQIDEHFMALDTSERLAALEGIDALMTNLGGVCIGVSTADCIPILLYDATHHAVSAIHAGWRGTVARIVMKTIEAMTKAFGTHPQELTAQIGPGIHIESFEVGDEVYDAFTREGFDMTTISRREGKWHIDLPKCNRQQLTAAGLLPQHIAVSPVCTVKQSDNYFSARCLGIESGRIFSGIMLCL